MLLAPAPAPCATDPPARPFKTNVYNSHQQLAALFMIASVMSRIPQQVALICKETRKDGPKSTTLYTCKRVRVHCFRKTQDKGLLCFPAAAPKSRTSLPAATAADHKDTPKQEKNGLTARPRCQLFELLPSYFIVQRCYGCRCYRRCRRCAAAALPLPQPLPPRRLLHDCRSSGCGRRDARTRRQAGPTAS